LRYLEDLIISWIKIILLIIIPLSLPACIRQQPAFVPVIAGETGESVIYLYRENNLSNILVSPDLLVDGEKKTIIRNNSYIKFLLKSGQHNIKLDLSDRYEGKIELNVSLGESRVYYFKVTTKMTFRMNQPYDRRFDIQQVNSSLALRELQEIPSIDKKTTSRQLTVKEDKNIEIKNESSFSIQKTRTPFSR
jgi:hypothetical protein